MRFQAFLDKNDGLGLPKKKELRCKHFNHLIARFASERATKSFASR